MRHRKIARFVLFVCCGADIAVHRTCNETLKRKLRELYKYTVYLDVADKWATNTQLDQLEGRFLDENDIETYVNPRFPVLALFPKHFAIRKYISILLLSLHSANIAGLAEVDTSTTQRSHSLSLDSNHLYRRHYLLHHPRSQYSPRSQSRRHLPLLAPVWKSNCVQLLPRPLFQRSLYHLRNH
jgi:hypothetical protein